MDTLTTPTTSFAIPQYLVYEEINGKPIYYKGYEEVLAQQKKMDDIMGCGTLQFLLIGTLLKWLYRTLPDNTYRIATNEAGLHLSKGNNIAGDILIFDWLALSKIDRICAVDAACNDRGRYKSSCCRFLYRPQLLFKKNKLIVKGRCRTGNLDTKRLADDIGGYAKRGLEIGILETLGNAYRWLLILPKRTNQKR